MASKLGSMMNLGVTLSLCAASALFAGCGSADTEPTETAPQATYVLVHGAWGAAWNWDQTQALLEDEGHAVVTVELPGHGDDTTPAADLSLQAYTDRVVAELDAAEEPVILVGHSMGGTVVSQAAEARPEKVKTLVYLAAYLLQDGQSLLDIAQTDAGSQLGGYLGFSEDGSEVSLSAEAMGAVFCDDCDGAAVADLEARLRPEAVAPLGTPIEVTEARWGSVPRVYIETTGDKVLSPDMQRQLYTASPCDQVLTLESSHAPFLSMPDALADHLLSL